MVIGKIKVAGLVVKVVSGEGCDFENIIAVLVYGGFFLEERGISRWFG